MNKKYLPQLVILTSAVLIFVLVLAYVGFVSRTQVKGTGSLKVIFVAALTQPPPSPLSLKTPLRVKYISHQQQVIMSLQI